MYLGARDESRGIDVAAALDGDVRALTLDGADPDTVAAAARRIEADAGRLDVLVNTPTRSHTAAGGISSRIDRTAKPAQMWMIPCISAQMPAKTSSVYAFSMKN